MKCLLTVLILLANMAVQAQTKETCRVALVQAHLAWGDVDANLEAFQKRADTLTIALSDHGTCYGEDGYEYHCISHETVYTVPYKHFILPKK